MEFGRTDHAEDAGRYGMEIGISFCLCVFVAPAEHGLWVFCSGRSIGRLHIQLCGRDGNQSIDIRLHYIRLSTFPLMDGYYY